ncbi:MAG: TlyA family RNA methyltransferase [Spirochaetota bacterium]
MARPRLLDRLCELHPTMDREQLLARVLCGEVRVDGELVRDPRRPVSREQRVAVVVDHADAAAGDYVSRGGLKLEHAIRAWSLSVSGKVFLDAGSSTGGFTDCLLRHGARAVHAVDVGYNQLAYALRTDERVIIHERTNIMDVTSLEPRPHAAVADLSFRSLRGAAARLLDLVSDSWAVLLVKPQFEWRSPPPEFDGIVPEEAVDAIVRETLSELESDGIDVAGVEESPIRGRKGNREFLVLARLATT